LRRAEKRAAPQVGKEPAVSIRERGKEKDEEVLMGGNRKKRKFLTKRGEGCFYLTKGGKKRQI